MFVQKKYNILNPNYGSGSFSQVQLLEDQQTKQKYILKRVPLRHKCLINETDEISMGIHEALLLSKLSHPHIIRLKECWIENLQTVCIVVEWGDLGDLYEWITKLSVEDQTLNEFQIRGLIMQIVSALLYLEGKKVLHGDLKPENILLFTDHKNPEGLPLLKLGDFGLAQEGIGQSVKISTLDMGSRIREDKHTQKLRSAGSPHYSALEVWNHVPPTSVASDIWSLGVILYNLLTGQSFFLFDPENPDVYRDPLTKKWCFRMDALHSVLQDTKYSYEVRDLLSNILQIDPQKRLTLLQIESHPWISEFLSCPLEPPVVYVHSTLPPSTPREEHAPEQEKICCCHSFCKKLVQCLKFFFQ